MSNIFSIEDGNLQNRPLTVSIDREYSDIDCTFTTSPTTKALYKKTDAASVRQAVKNLLMTNRGSIPFRPYFGGDLEGMLFSLSTELNESDIEDTIRLTIKNHEPRAEVREVTARFNEDTYSLKVTLVFGVVNTQKVVTMDLTIARSR
jgi:phage baseplate assembly protein W